jgi:histidine ammonia-lyase
MLEQLKWCHETITVNVNGASDNPLWVSDECATPGETPWQWVSGGNFMAMHMAESLDALRKITTQLIKKHDRHLARLIDVNDNNGLSANLSWPDAAVTQCTFKGVQILSGMLEVQSMMLANPVTTLFGVHEERNQDITSHATTSGNLALRNLELLKYSISGNLLAVAQAADLRGGPAKLSPRSRPLYRFIRERCDVVREERPLHQDIEALAATIEDGSLVAMLLRDVMLDFTPSTGDTEDASSGTTTDGTNMG